MLIQVTPVLIVLASIANATSTEQHTPVPFTHSSIIIDGKLNESIWQTSTRLAINHPIIGGEPQPNDFSGTYQLAWDAGYLYIAAQIRDDILFDQHPDPLHYYWDDDCLEIFIDEDASGGDHQYNYNAFAYHVALDGNAVDIGESHANEPTNFVLLNNHIQSQWTRNKHDPTLINWEVRVEIHNDQFSPNNPSEASLVTLTENKTIGFMLAYCDNDGSEHREQFIGSHYIAPVDGDQNLGYKTADVFGKIKLQTNSAN
ncbi:MAG: sugar-binding protein [Glaciecola sp.]